MMVISFKLQKKQLLVLLVLAVLLVGALVFAAVNGGNARAVSAGYVLDASTDAQRKAFLAQYGWTTAADPVEICEVIIPEQFNDVYTQYNALQQTQGFDLMPFRGQRVKRWTYEITNYPSETDGLRVYADLLVRDGKVIGGNVGTRAADGFLHGFARGSALLQNGASSERVPSVPGTSSTVTSTATGSV